MRNIHVIGAGLAGCEAAWQIAALGVNVCIHEMKPDKKTPAHKENGFAELVCSNSLRSDRLSNAAGLLKEEMRRLDSLVMRAADTSSVPAGGALAVDRGLFSKTITSALFEHPMITVKNHEVLDLNAFGDEIVIVASGPLTTDTLASSITDLTGEEALHFFDAAAPIIEGQSIDMSKAFFASRYERGKRLFKLPNDQRTIRRLL